MGDLLVRWLVEIKVLVLHILASLLFSLLLLLSPSRPIFHQAGWNAVMWSLVLLALQSVEPPPPPPLPPPPPPPLRPSKDYHMKWSDMGWEMYCGFSHSKRRWTEKEAEWDWDWIGLHCSSEHKWDTKCKSASKDRSLMIEKSSLIGGRKREKKRRTPPFSQLLSFYFGAEYGSWFDNKLISLFWYHLIRRRRGNNIDDISIARSLQSVPSLSIPSGHCTLWVWRGRGEEEGGGASLYLEHIVTVNPFEWGRDLVHHGFILTRKKTKTIEFVEGKSVQIEIKMGK